LQRQCACGEVTGSVGACNERQYKDLALQKRFPNRAESNQRPPILHEAVSMPDQSGISIQGTSPASQAGNATGQEEKKKRPELFDSSSGNAQEAGVRFSDKKAVCIPSNGLDIKTGIYKNNDELVQGSLRINYKAEGKSRYVHQKGTGETKLIFARGKRQMTPDGKICNCDCMSYRQYIRAIASVRPLGQSTYQPLKEVGTRGGPIAADQQWHMDDATSIPGEEDVLGCERNFKDNPGVTGGAKAGVGVLLRYNFLHQIWDICQQKPAKEVYQTLTIAGDTPPRIIKWDFGLKPLNLDDIQKLLPSQTQQENQ
jgi:hypothetical protein